MIRLARSPLIPAAFFAALLWAIAIFTESDAVLGVGIAHAALKGAAVAVTAVLAVMLAG
jgi:hypothetical protein